VTPSQQQPKRYRREHVTVALTIPACPLLLEEAKARGWRLVYLWHWNNVLPERLKPQGALINELPGSPLVRDLREMGCACVRLGNLPHPDDSQLLAILPDHEAEGRLAAEHFAERDFRHVAYWGRNPWGDSLSMFVGFEKRTEELGMVCHLHRFRRKRNESSKTNASRSRHEFSQWLHGLPKPVGLLAAGEWQAAKQCIDVCEAGLHVPDDVAVLASANSHNLCQSCLPTISSLDINEEGRVHAACDWLEKLMNGETMPKEPIMIAPKGVIERESTSILATSDRIVAEALHYIWDHLQNDLPVNTIADMVGLSTSQLQRRFKTALGRSVVQELLRKRLDEARHLLRASNLPIADIGPKLGFHSDSYLYRSFRKQFGMTPAQYRKKQ